MWTETQARAAFAGFTCGDQVQRARAADFAAESWALGCGGKGNPGKYLLAPAGVQGADIATARAAPQPANGGAPIEKGRWMITLDFNNDSFAKLSALTCPAPVDGCLGQGGVPIAIVLDGVVLSAPTNAGPIDGPADITGDFTEAQARSLMDTISLAAAGVRFTNVSVTTVR